MDILKDLHERLIAIGFNDPKITKVVFEVARDYEGERPYISTKPEKDCMMSERNRAIIRDFRSGERITFLSRRYGLSRQRIWKIING